MRKRASRNPGAAYTGACGSWVPALRASRYGGNDTITLLTKKQKTPPSIWRAGFSFTCSACPALGPLRHRGRHPALHDPRPPCRRRRIPLVFSARLPVLFSRRLHAQPLPQFLDRPSSSFLLSSLRLLRCLEHRLKVHAHASPFFRPRSNNRPTRFPRYQQRRTRDANRKNFRGNFSCRDVRAGKCL